MKKILSLVMALALILSCMCLPASADVKYDVTLRVEVFDRSIAGLNLEDCWPRFRGRETRKPLFTPLFFP